MNRLPDYYLGWRELEPFAGQGVPILMYHKLAFPRVGRSGRGALLYVSPQLFRRQLAELRRAGLDSRPLDWVTTAPENGERGLVLTFDDGFENVFRHALPPLAEYGYRAVVYLVADLLGRENLWEQPAGFARERLMDPAQVREWLGAGHTIGAHTLTHPHLTQLPRDRAREEITASKKKLEDLFGVEVSDFCYPYGDHDPAICDLVAEAGYRTATITTRGFNSQATPPLALRRFMVRYPKFDLGGWWRVLTGC
jgi:peptidoglycan/xylan/chitin deacetylase (PgdA/CDA1 family)